MRFVTLKMGLMLAAGQRGGGGEARRLSNNCGQGGAVLACAGREL